MGINKICVNIGVQNNLQSLKILKIEIAMAKRFFPMVINS